MIAQLEPENCQVALLVGGTSGEREVSLASGRGAKTALEQAGFPVTVLDSAKKEDLIALIEGDFDVAFICLHGRCGEDGTMQGFLEVIGLPYVGSRVCASAVSMDKAKSKVFYDLKNIKTPPSMLLRSGEPTTTSEIIKTIGFPAVVKPASEGSALGVFIVDDEDNLTNALKEAHKLDRDVLVEKYIKGIELTVAVLGNEDAYALPVIEIIPQNGFYDFESKYAPGGSRHVCPAELDEATTQRVQELAVAAHKVLECEGVSRSDFILESNGDLWILETNTIPGMTETSLLPEAGRAANMSFPQLCTCLIEYALKNAASTKCEK